jgi:hypothetical protein
LQLFGESPQGERFLEPLPLTVVQTKACIGVLCTLRAAGGEFFLWQKGDGMKPSKTSLIHV